MGKPVLVEYLAVHSVALFDRQLGVLLRRHEADGATEEELMARIHEVAGRFGLAIFVTPSTADAIVFQVRSGWPVVPTPPGPGASAGLDQAPPVASRMSVPDGSERSTLTR